MRLWLSALVAALGVVGTGANAVPINLGTWTAESYQAINGFSTGKWLVAPDGTSVSQSVNGQPTLFYSDFTAFGTNVTGRVNSHGTDDDYIGFALGFHPGNSTNLSANYLLIDWKRNTQNSDFPTPSASPGGNGIAGLAVSEVTGVPDADEFWQHGNLSGTPSTSGVQELARGTTLGSIGWSPNTDYAFAFNFGPGNFQMFVDGIMQFDIAGSFTDGAFAFYNFSEANTVYSAFDVTPAVPEPTTLALFGAGLVCFALLRRRRKR